ncbi:MAG: GNAT family N-acetyltransferase [Gaiellaceae bacterium]
MREVPAGAWDELLAQLDCADAYLLRAYLEASCVLDPGEPVLLEDDGVVMACIVRAINASESDVTTPYGYGGPVGAGSHDRFYEAYEAWCRDRGIVSTFIRYHPLFENYSSALRASYSSPTVGWLLDGDLLASIHGKHRNVVRKAQKAGVAVDVTAGPDDLSAFVELYEQTMERRNAAGYYFLPPEYWERLTELEGNLVRFDALAGGDVVASALCLRGDRWLHYHFGATADSARDLGASNLLLYTAALWGQTQQLEEFHLGGGAGGKQDSLYAFKERFSPRGRREFWVGKAVHDEDAYRRLCGGAEIDYDGFFPAYRTS